MCGVTGKRRTSDLNVTGSRPPLATRYIRCVLLVNSPNKLNLFSWVMIYLYFNYRNIVICFGLVLKLGDFCRVDSLGLRNRQLSLQIINVLLFE